MKDEIKFKCSSALSVASLSAAKDLSKTMNKVGLDINPKSEGEGSSPKKDRRLSPHNRGMDKDLKSPHSLATMS